MCVTPCYLPSIQVGDTYREAVMVACRYCWQCRMNRMNDWIGRCIAEKENSTAALAVTLTYAGDYPNSATLVYKDFQDFMKRLRKAGYRARYLVAGEYGSKKDRAHWHAILFFQGKAPRIVEDPRDRGPYDVVLPRFDGDPWARIQWKPWSNDKDRGHAYFQHVDYDGFAYILKYILKDTDADYRVGQFAMSKKPPIGFDWFMDLAQHYVDRGLSPLSPEYSFRDQFDKRNRRRKFWLQGRMREMFLDRFLELYRAKHGKEWDLYQSPFVEDQLDRQCRGEIVGPFNEEAWRIHLDRRTYAAPEPEAIPQVDHIALRDLGIILTVFEGGLVEITWREGEEPWPVENETQAAVALTGLGLPTMLRGEILARIRPHWHGNGLPGSAVA